ncbi:MAG: N-acetyltransferase [Chloroflexi bacterium]|nr:N-acetyltransferase [Chloroflexota bacterium]
MENSTPQIIHNTEQNRFETQLDGHTAQLNYQMTGKTIIFTHTGVPPALEGRGIGSLLVRTGLEYARGNNLKVKALCWFVSGYIQRHPEYRDLTG